MMAGRFAGGLGPQARHRLLVWGLAALAGALPPWLWGWPQRSALTQLEDELAQWRNRASSLPPDPAPPPATLAPPDWPAPEQATSVWSWLRQGAQAHGLQVLALQASAQQISAGGADLAELPVRLRLLGPWPDWLAFVAVLDAQAPWWVIDQWQVVPDAQLAGQVRIDVQGRVGLQPQTDPARSPMPRVWPAWPQARVAAGADAGIFAFVPLGSAAAAPSAPASSGPASASAPAPEASAPWSADPSTWPVQQLQLLGVWSQAGVTHAVLGRGLAQVTVSPGQRIGREAYRVRRIWATGVELQAPGATGPEAVLTLTWTGGP